MLLLRAPLMVVMQGTHSFDLGVDSSVFATAASWSEHSTFKEGMSISPVWSREMERSNEVTSPGT